jgi:tRNA (guanosine-2'-O-)-methyltransferase
MLLRRKQRIKKVLSRRQQGVVVLEDITDPHNAAAVFRSCDAFGIQDVYLIFNQEEKFNPKKIGKSSSSSANKWLTFHIYDSTAECLADLKKQGFRIIATVLDVKAKSLYKVNFKKKKIALLFGNEHRGLSENAKALADEKVYIPMQGMVESLNLSVSAAVCLSELFRQRKGKKKYRLEKFRRKELQKEWK